MDLHKPAMDRNSEPLNFGPAGVKYTAIGIFVLEMLLSLRQFMLLNRQTGPIPAYGSPERQSTNRAQLKTIYQILSSAGTMVQVVFFVGLNIIPLLWTIAGDIQLSYSPFLQAAIWRSCVFMAACWSIYLCLNTPGFLFRAFILEENVLKNWNPSWVVHDLIRNKIVPSTLIFMAAIHLFYQGFSIKFDQNHIFAFATVDLIFVFFYPILTQPWRKYLTPMASSPLRDSVQALAATAKFPLKDIFVTNQSLYNKDSGLETSVQTSGWPKKTYIVVKQKDIEKEPVENILALLAHELGCWRSSNDIRATIVSQLYIIPVFLMATLFLKHDSYEEFGFGSDYSKIAGLLLFAVGLGRILYVYTKVQMNVLRRKNTFLADKFAAELGYSLESSAVLSKTSLKTMETTKVNALYSIYYNMTPLTCERLEVLEKWRRDQEGSISLPKKEEKKLSTWFMG